MPVLDNPRHELFVQALARGETGTAAYCAAGYEEHDSNAARLRAEPHIEARLSELMQIAATVAAIDAARVLQELGRVGFGDLRQAFDDDGRLKAPKDWSAEFAASVSSIEVVSRNAGEGQVEYVHKLRTWDKNSALEKIGKHLNMFVERHELTGKDGRDLMPEQPTTVDLAKVLVDILNRAQPQRIER